jgi:hypothetical protein
VASRIILLMYLEHALSWLGEQECECERPCGREEWGYLGVNFADALSMLREGLDMQPQLKSSQVSRSRSLVREWYCGVNSLMRNVGFEWVARLVPVSNDVQSKHQ